MNVKPLHAEDFIWAAIFKHALHPDFFLIVELVKKKISEFRSTGISPALFPPGVPSELEIKAKRVLPGALYSSIMDAFPTHDLKSLEMTPLRSPEKVPLPLNTAARFAWHQSTFRDRAEHQKLKGELLVKRSIKSSDQFIEYPKLSDDMGVTESFAVNSRSSFIDIKTSVALGAFQAQHQDILDIVPKDLIRLLSAATDCTDDGENILLFKLNAFASLKYALSKHQRSEYSDPSLFRVILGTNISADTEMQVYRKFLWQWASVDKYKRNDARMHIVDEYTAMLTFKYKNALPQKYKAERFKLFVALSTEIITKYDEKTTTDKQTQAICKRMYDKICEARELEMAPGIQDAIHKAYKDEVRLVFDAKHDVLWIPRAIHTWTAFGIAINEAVKIMRDHGEMPGDIRDLYSRILDIKVDYPYYISLETYRYILGSQTTTRIAEAITAIASVDTDKDGNRNHVLHELFTCYMLAATITESAHIFDDSPSCTELFALMVYPGRPEILIDALESYIVNLEKATWELPLTAEKEYKIFVKCATLTKMIKREYSTINLEDLSVYNKIFDILLLTHPIGVDPPCGDNDIPISEYRSVPALEYYHTAARKWCKDSSENIVKGINMLCDNIIAQRRLRHTWTPTTSDNIHECHRKIESAMAIKIQDTKLSHWVASTVRCSSMYLDAVISYYQKTSK
jgi:hypothetical protein